MKGHKMAVVIGGIALDGFEDLATLTTVLSNTGKDLSWTSPSLNSAVDRRCLSVTELKEFLKILKPLLPDILQNPPIKGQ